MVEPHERSGIAVERLGLINAAERASRCEPRFVRAHALPPKRVFEEREVGGDLARELRFGARRIQKAEDPVDKPSHVEAPHGTGHVCRCSLVIQVKILPEIHLRVKCTAERRLRRAG
jgi:hypothetical protein